jgi:hypothetical protein
VARLRIQSQTLTHTAGENTATASFRPRPPLELYFATDRISQREAARRFGIDPRTVAKMLAFSVPRYRRAA